jgi:hypothetical protein
MTMTAQQMKQVFLLIINAVANSQPGHAKRKVALCTRRRQVVFPVTSKWAPLLAYGCSHGNAPDPIRIVMFGVWFIIHSLDINLLLVRQRRRWKNFIGIAGVIKSVFSIY